MSRSLRDLLDALNRAQAVDPEPIAPDQILRRVRRRRTLRTATAGVASAAIVLGIGAGVYALAGDSAPVPPAPPVPTVAPTPTSTGSPRPQPTPEQTPDALGTTSLVAITAAGAVVLVNPDDGAVVRTVYEGIATGDSPKVSISLTPDRRQAYVGHSPSADDGSTRFEILRISLDDGVAEVVAAGFQPSVSPDGSTLAYAGHAADGRFGIILRDLPSGSERFIDPGFGLDAFGEANPAAWIDQLAWSPEGSRLFAPVGMEGSVLYSVDASADTFEGAEELGDDGVQENEPVVLLDGTLVVYSFAYSVAGDPHGGYLAVLDPVTGETMDRITTADLHVTDLAANPSKRGLALTAVPFAREGELGLVPDLYLWEGGGEPRLLATGFVAVAW